MDTCPNCGYCKHCGRSAQPVPSYPSPYFYPWWQQPTHPYGITWCGTDTAQRVTPTIANGASTTSVVTGIQGIPFTYTS